jgi:hypothetical protein
MSITGALRSTSVLTGQIFGTLGLLGAYAFAILANASESPHRPLFRRKRAERLCTNCAGFIEPGDTKCRYCGADVE